MCGTHLWINLFGLVVYAILEYWLGKTEKLKAGSVLELILILGIKILYRGKETKNVTESQRT